MKEIKGKNGKGKEYKEVKANDRIKKKIKDTKAKEI